MLFLLLCCCCGRHAHQPEPVHCSFLCAASCAASRSCLSTTSETDKEFEVIAGMWPKQSDDVQKVTKIET